MKATRSKVNEGDFVILRENAEVFLREGNSLSLDLINDGSLWSVDDYMEESMMVNISRLEHPYPGAFSSWVHEENILKWVRRIK